MKPKYDKALRPFVKEWSDLINAQFRLMGAMTLTELQDLRSACVELNETNCWWLTYHIAGPMGMDWARHIDSIITKRTEEASMPVKHEAN